MHVNLPVVGNGTSSEDVLNGFDDVDVAVDDLGFIATVVSVFVGSDGSLSFLAAFVGSTGTHSLSLAR